MPGFQVTRVPCGQDQARYIEGITAADGERLRGMRKTILDLKLGVLEEAEPLLRSAVPGDCWTNYLPLFRNALTVEEAVFCVRLDQIYQGQPDQQEPTDSLITAMLGYEGPLQPGGLTNIIELIGHVEKEITIGTMHQTRVALEYLVTNVDGGPALLRTNSWPYFFLVGCDDREVLDHAIDVFRQCDEREAAFWPEFRDRASLALANELDREVVARVRARPATAEELRLNVQTYAEFARSFLLMSGRLPLIQITALESFPECGTGPAAERPLGEHLSNNRQRLGNQIPRSAGKDLSRFGRPVLHLLTRPEPKPELHGKPAQECKDPLSSKNAEALGCVGGGRCRRIWGPTACLTRCGRTC